MTDDDGFQLTLAVPDQRLPLHIRFSMFDAANPHVMDELVMLARRAKRLGAEKIGIAELFEVLRWRSRMRTHGSDFKLDNSFRAFYVREMMRRYPDIDGLFELRRSVADEVV